MIFVPVLSFLLYGTALFRWSAVFIFVSAKAEGFPFQRIPRPLLYGQNAQVHV